MIFYVHQKWGSTQTKSNQIKQNNKQTNYYKGVKDPRKCILESSSEGRHPRKTVCPRQSKKSSVVDITTYIYEEPMGPQVGGPEDTAVFRLPSKTLACIVRSVLLPFFFSTGKQNYSANKRKTTITEP